MIFRCAVPLMALALLAGCASTPVPESERPATLEPLISAVNVYTAWSHSIGAWSEAIPGHIMPVVADDHVFVVDGKDRLWAYEAANGKVLWDHVLKKSITAGLVADKDILFAGTRGAEVLAISQKDGALVWSAQVSSTVLALPAVGHGVVAVRTVDGKLFVLDELTGRQRWVNEYANPTLTLQGTSSVVITASKVFAGFDNGKLAAFDLESGNLLWETGIAVPEGRSELERMVDVDADPVLGDDVVYAVAYQGRLAAVVPETGRILWTREMSSYAGLAYEKDIYIADAQSHVWGLDSHNGASLWKQEKLHMRNVTRPVVTGDYVMVSDFEGYLHWLDKSDGRLAGRYRADEQGLAGDPLVTHDFIYVLGKSGVLKALKIKSP